MSQNLLKRITLVMATLSCSVAILSQNLPVAAANRVEGQTRSQTVVLTVEMQSAAPQSNADVLVSVDKQPFVPVLAVQGASSAPVDFVLVVDGSSSAARSKLRSTALNEVPNFINGLRNSGLTVRTAVVEFDATPRIVQDFTASPIDSSLKRLSWGGGGSALHDALVVAARLSQHSPASSRRIILVVSDGEDNQSHATAEEVVTTTARASALIYALSLGEPSAEYAPIAGRGEKFLKYVSAQSGGKAYFPKKQSQVAEALAAMSADLQAQYFVAIPTSGKGLHNLQFKTSIPHGTVRGPTVTTSE